MDTECLLSHIAVLVKSRVQFRGGSNACLLGASASTTMAQLRRRQCLPIQSTWQPILFLLLILTRQTATDFSKKDDNLRTAVFLHTGACNSVTGNMDPVSISLCWCGAGQVSTAQYHFSWHRDDVALYQYHSAVRFPCRQVH